MWKNIISPENTHNGKFTKSMGGILDTESTVKILDDVNSKNTYAETTVIKTFVAMMRWSFHDSRMIFFFGPK